MLSCIANFFTQPCLFFSIIGKLAVTYVAFRALYRAWQFLKLYVLSPSFGLSLNLKSYGKWAIVTGATDGIGKAYAEQLAKKGMNLVLVSRTASRLVDAAKEIEGKYKDIEVKWVVADFSDMGVYKHIGQQLEGLDIGVLVNNVGMSYENPAFFQEVSEEEAKKILIVNTFSVVLMSKLVLDRMLVKKAGVIVNISSLSARLPVPLLAIYGATKAFVRSLSKSMQCEYASKGLVVQCVCPSLVATKLSKIRRTGFMVPSPQEFSSSCINTLGLQDDVTGCLGHELQASAVDLIGEGLAAKFFFSQAMVARKKALQKKEREEAKSKEQ